MPATFTERSDLERGFQAVFEREIAPKLGAMESGRLGLREGTRRELAVVAAAGAMLAVAIPVVFGMEARGFAILPLIAAAVLGAWMVYRRQEAWQQGIIDAVVPVFCGFLGDLRYQRDGIGEDWAAPFQDLGLVGPSNRQTLRHHFAGRHRNTGFELIHAELSRRSGGKNKSTTRVFHGLLFRIEVPVSVPMPIVVTPAFGAHLKLLEMFMPRVLTSMRVVPTGDAAFDEKLTVRAPVSDPRDEAAVRAFLTPGFRAALLAIDEEEGGLAYGRGALSAAFTGGTFYMALSRWEVSSVGPIKVERPRGFLRTGSFLRLGLDLEATIHDMFDDVGTAHRIIDRLHGQ